MIRLELERPDTPDVKALLDQHFALMRMQSPPESCHVLPSESLNSDDIRLFALRRDTKIVAVGAIRIDGRMGELKSMHTAAPERGKGLGRVLLQGLISEARALGLTELALETGSGSEHEAARGLYASEGFATCPPFGPYSYDPLSLFMRRTL